MYRLVLLIIASMLANCRAKQIHFELANDPNYPQLISVSDVYYNFVTNKYIDVSAVVTIHEEINDGTNVSDSYKIKYCSVFQITRKLQKLYVIHF